MAKKYEVEVIGTYGEIQEDKMDQFAEELLGERVGSGCFIPTNERDIQYQFTSEHRAKCFVKTAKKAVGVKAATLLEY